MAYGNSIRKSQKILIAKLFVEGMAQNCIANEVGLSRVTVSRYINHDDETKELIKNLESKYHDEIFNQCINDMKQGFEVNSRNLEMIAKGYNK